jgi:hypothetical protein
MAMEYPAFIDLLGGLEHGLNCPYIGNNMDYSGLMNFNGFPHIYWEFHQPN